MWLVLWLVLVFLTPPARAGDFVGPPAPDRVRTKTDSVNVRWGWQEGLIIGASLADLATTELALRTPGAVEGNPLVVSRAVRVPLKLAYTGVVLWLYRSLERRGQHGWAKVVLVWSVAIWTGAAVWNVNQAR